MSMINIDLLHKKKEQKENARKKVQQKLEEREMWLSLKRARVCSQ